MGLLGFNGCGRGFDRFVRLCILAYKAIGGTIYTGLALKKIYAVCSVVGADATARGANIVNAFGAGYEVGAALKVILRHGGTIEMGTSGEGAANAKDNSKGQNGPFELFTRGHNGFFLVLMNLRFHTKLFLVITIDE